MPFISQFYNDSDAFFREFDNLFNAAFDARTAKHRPPISRFQRQNTVLKPKMDIHESKEHNELIATFELPGTKKEDISIDIDTNRLTVSGCSSMSNDLEKDGYSVRERRYGDFSRSIPLPQGVKYEDIKATMADGILTMKFPRSTPEQAPTRIAIN